MSTNQGRLLKIRSTKKSSRILFYIFLTFLSALPNMETIIGMSMKSIERHENSLILIDTIVFLLVISLFFVVYRKIRVNLVQNKLLKNIVITIVMALCAIGLDMFFSTLPIPSNQLTINEMNAVAPILNALRIRIFAPIIEELLTRGIFMNLFFTKNTKLTIVFRIFFSGLFFGLSHGITPSVSILFYCGMGWILACTYYLCKNNITFPICIHILVNNL